MVETNIQLELFFYSNYFRIIRSVFNKKLLNFTDFLMISFKL